MSQVDNRNSSAGKRARTDGGRREDDWTCPSCGNVNFSFRTTCNMHNCTQSRPSDHSMKSAPKPQHAPSSYQPSAGYMGSGAPSTMYHGTPPYGSSVFGGAVPYDRPFSGGSAYRYDYGSRLSVGSPYGPLHLSGVPHYSSASMFSPGGVYGVPPMMDRYGLGLPMGPGTLGPRSGVFLEERLQEKPEDAGRENDWKCPNCGNNNFSFRSVCNMRKCNTPRPGGQASKSENSKGSKPKTPEGSWKCEKCSNINYPFRTKCNRQNCGADKPSELNQTTEEDDQGSGKKSSPEVSGGRRMCEQARRQRATIALSLTATHTLSLSLSLSVVAAGRGRRYREQAAGDWRCVTTGRRQLRCRRRPHLSSPHSRFPSLSQLLSLSRCSEALTTSKSVGGQEVQLADSEEVEQRSPSMELAGTVKTTTKTKTATVRRWCSSPTVRWSRRRRWRTRRGRRRLSLSLSISLSRWHFVKYPSLFFFELCPHFVRNSPYIFVFFELHPQFSGRKE